MKINYGNNCIGFVVRIISNTQLIIDIGSDKLTVGDVIQIYDPSDEIFDLEGNSLGIFEKIKATLNVIYTSTDYSVCANKKEITENIMSDMLASLPSNLLFPKTIIKEEQLNIISKDIEPLTLEDTQSIKKGDPVKKR